MSKLYFAVERHVGREPLLIQSGKTIDEVMNALSRNSKHWEYTRIYELDTTLLDWSPVEALPVPADAIQAVQA